MGLMPECVSGDNASENIIEILRQRYLLLPPMRCVGYLSDRTPSRSDNNAHSCTKAFGSNLC